MRFGPKTTTTVDSFYDSSYTLQQARWLISLSELFLLELCAIKPNFGKTLARSAVEKSRLDFFRKCGDVNITPGARSNSAEIAIFYFTSSPMFANTYSKCIFCLSCPDISQTHYFFDWPRSTVAFL
mmetsp:Transcript_2079/g.4495  ORF Transcript_2079/g.4495 Transcript_2079/m.4495 type:complete len:126 (-) Transcript_2079:1227-1604(-)